MINGEYVYITLNSGKELSAQYHNDNGIYFTISGVNRTIPIDWVKHYEEQGCSCDDCEFDDEEE